MCPLPAGPPTDRLSLHAGWNLRIKLCDLDTRTPRLSCESHTQGHGPAFIGRLSCLGTAGDSTLGTPPSGETADTGCHRIPWHRKRRCCDSRHGLFHACPSKCIRLGPAAYSVTKVWKQDLL
jgi:hypothetical protein